MLLKKHNFVKKLAGQVQIQTSRTNTYFELCIWFIEEYNTLFVV